VGRITGNIHEGATRPPPRPRLLPHLDLRSRRPRSTPVLTLPPSPPSKMTSSSYRPSSATSTPTPAPLLRRVPPTPVRCLFLPWQYYYSCALSLSFCPALCSCPPPLPRTTVYSLTRTPPRAHAPHPATLATDYALVAVAAMPFNPTLFPWPICSRDGIWGFLEHYRSESRFSR